MDKYYFTYYQSLWKVEGLKLRKRPHSHFSVAFFCSHFVKMENIGFLIIFTILYDNSRILATLEAKSDKISNFWTFCTVILLNSVKGRCISWITVQNVQKLLILAVLASNVASILKNDKNEREADIFHFHKMWKNTM